MMIVCFDEFYENSAIKWFIKDLLFVPNWNRRKLFGIYVWWPSRTYLISDMSKWFPVCDACTMNICFDVRVCIVHVSVVWWFFCAFVFFFLDKSKTGLKRKSSTDFSKQSVKKVKESNDGPPVRNLDKMESVLSPRLPLGNIPRLPTLTHSGNTDSQKARQTNGNIVGKALSKNSSTGIKKPQTGIGGHQNKDVKMNVKAGAPTVSKKMSQDSKGQGASKVPLCPGHSKPCSMTQTRKKGDNFLRWFFSCGVYPRSKQCKFFQVIISNRRIILRLHDAPNILIADGLF